MCDFSLMTIPNRLAISGEELVVHRFEAGSVVGLASARAISEKDRSSAGFNLRGSGRGSKAFSVLQMGHAVNTFRDAVRLQNGVEWLLQRLAEGQRVRLLDLSSAEDEVTVSTGAARVHESGIGGTDASLTCLALIRSELTSTVVVGQEIQRFKEKTK